MTGSRAAWTAVVVAAVAMLLAPTISARQAAGRASQAAPGGNTAISYPKPTATTPAACRAEVQDFVAAQNKAAGISRGPITDRALIATSQRINAARLAMTRECAAKFEVATTADSDLDALANLYLDASMIDQAKAASERELALGSLSPRDRAAAVITGISVARRATPSKVDRAWRVANMYPKVEALIDELEGNPSATFEQKWSLRTSMEGTYRGDDIDAGILKHGAWILEQARLFPPELRKKYGGTVVSAHVNMAEAYAGQAMNDKALTLLRSAKSGWKDAVPDVDDRIDPTLRRYELVGTRAAAITASTWLNAPAGTTRMAMPGSVTLLEFSAHWCGPCRESYPGLNRLRERFKNDAFRVVMVTRLWGYFATERSLPADQEIARDREYFAEHGLDVPVAIGPQVNVTVEGGKVVYTPGPDRNDTAYAVGGIPQVQIIDKKGTIRLIMVGYDATNEEKLATLIEGLLKEK